MLAGVADANYHQLGKFPSATQVVLCKICLVEPVITRLLGNIIVFHSLPIFAIFSTFEQLIIAEYLVKSYAYQLKRSPVSLQERVTCFSCKFMRSTMKISTNMFCMLVMPIYINL